MPFPGVIDDESSPSPSFPHFVVCSSIVAISREAFQRCGSIPILGHAPDCQSHRFLQHNLATSSCSVALPSHCVGSCHCGSPCEQNACHESCERWSITPLRTFQRERCQTMSCPDLITEEGRVCAKKTVKTRASGQARGKRSCDSARMPILSLCDIVTHKERVHNGHSSYLSVALHT